MSDYEVDSDSKQFSINLTTDRQYSADAVRAILSTILFHRLFGSLTPTCSEAVGVTYPVAMHSETEGIILERYKDLSRKFRDSSVKVLSIRVSFFSRRVKKSAWFAKTHSFCWESWNLDIAVSPSPSISDAASVETDVPRESTPRSTSSKELRRAMIEIIQVVDSYKSHIPPITTTDVSPFPYEITIL